MLQLKYLHTIKELINSLDYFDYALLTPAVMNFELPVVKVALRSDEKEGFLRQLQTTVPFETVQSKLDSTILIAELEGDKFLTIELYHFFHSDGLIYLNIEEVLERRTLSNKDVFVPTWEHLLEFSILNGFLNEEGINELIIRDLEDLHIFLQEGLLDYFNNKHDTYFQSPYDLLEYKETIANHFRKELKQFPANKFSNRLKLRWGNIKQVLKRSAIFSYMH